jgi:long-chain fatty acid transport protein
MKRITILVAMLFAGLQVAQAGGYMIAEMAARASGMGGAFTAEADDASAAWYNPAGVAFTEGRKIMVGGAVIVAPGAEYTPNAFSPPGAIADTAKDNTFVIPHAYFTYMDKESGLGASLSINSPFGLETEWRLGGPLQTASTFSRINMVMINPSVIFRISDQLSIAGGINYAYLNKVDFNSAAQLLAGEGEDGWGGNASVFYKGDGFNFGITYRSRITIDVNGVITGGPLLAGFGLNGATTAGATSLTLPDQVNVGFAWMPNKEWTFSVDVDWVNWKTFDSIDIVYTPAGLLTTVLTGGTNFKSIPENWSATIAFRVGAEWKYSEKMRARFGYVFDPTPIKDVDFTPGIPGNDRHIFSVGYGYDFNADTTLDLTYAFVYFKDRSQTASTGANIVRNGEYKSTAHIAMASLNYRF